MPTQCKQLEQKPAGERTQNLAMLWAKVLIWLMSFSPVVDRFRTLWKMDRLEKPEMASIFSCICFLVPMVLNEHYLKDNPNLVLLDQIVGQPGVMTIYCLLAVYQFIIVILGGEPSLCIKNERDKREWLWLRMIGLFIALGVWLLTAGFVSLHSITYGTLFFGGLGLWCGWWSWRIAFKYNVLTGAAQKIPESDSILVSEEPTLSPYL